MTPEERFDDLVDELLATDGVSPPSPGGGFGSSALRIQNKIFAMLVRGRLVVKLPKSRVDELVGAGEGDHFDANKGKPMKEWLNLSPASELNWSAIAHESLEFVNSPQRTRHK
jgi:TfoX/Sxy family transcriptional regulator of competence genes